MTSTAALGVRGRFFIGQQLTPTAINGLINWAIAHSQHPAGSRVALWGGTGYAGDLLATGALMPAISWVILFPLLRHQAMRGRAPLLDGLATPRLARWIPGRFWRGFLGAGIVGLVTVALPVTALLAIGGAPVFNGPAYSIFKGMYAGFVTGIVQPAMVFAALRSYSLGSGYPTSQPG